MTDRLTLQEIYIPFSESRFKKNIMMWDYGARRRRHRDTTTTHNSESRTEILSTEKRQYASRLILRLSVRGVLKILYHCAAPLVSLSLSGKNQGDRCTPAANQNDDIFFECSFHSSAVPRSLGRACKSGGGQDEKEEKARGRRRSGRRREI